MSWSTPAPKWDTIAGRVLDAFFDALRESLPAYEHPLTLFGSAPIQLCLDEDFASADIDLMVLAESEKLRQIAGKLETGSCSTIRQTYGVQICPPQLFKPTPHYLQRAYHEVRHGIRVIIPDLRDILIGKLHRSRYDFQLGLVPKDNRAFQRVRELCHGHPTKEEILEDLVQCESHFRPSHDGSVNSFRLNVEDMLREHYLHHFDLERDILSPMHSSQESSEHPAESSIKSRLDDLRPTRE